MAHSTYPWGGPYLKNLEGSALANFVQIGAENVHWNPETESYEIKITNGGYGAYMGVAGQLNDNADITAPVKSYAPNDFGLYNMSGNVAEMVKEEGLACGGGWRSPGFDIRCVSTLQYKGAQPDLGFRPIVEIIQN